MQKTSLTEAGQANLPTGARAGSSDDLIDAINQTFGLFRINFHNQYYKAFPDAETLTPVKKLWFESLSQFPTTVILLAAKQIIESSEYLPTLHKMIDTCWRLSGGSVPEAHAAYLEACRAPNPKQNAEWSHPAVYHAGKRSDWYFLASTSENIAYPVFNKHYQRIIEDIRDGKPLNLPEKTATNSNNQKKVLDKSSAHAKIASIRKSLED